MRDDYFALGLRQIATAVSFLSNDCALVHGGVSAAAVVVTDRLDWKLSGFDLVSELASVGRGTNGDARIVHSSFAVPDQYKPEEYRRGDWASVPEGPPWAIDAWGLGCLIQEVYRGEPLQRTDQLRETSRIPPALLKDYQKLLGSQPARRYNPKKLVDNSALFANKLVETTTFLDNLSLKDAIEKEQFFRHLPRVLESLAKPCVERKILPQVAEALVFGSAPALAVHPMLHAAKGLDAETFAARVTPTIVKLFTSSADKTVRMALLENLHAFAEHLPEKVVDETVWPATQTGFADEEPYLRELTLKSTLLFAPKLSQRSHQGMLKHLSKLQTDVEPAIRANTTILLGNVAGYLSETTAKRVLLNAFTRALRDPFPPARVAGVMALVATIAYYDPGECAGRVVPSVAPLCADPDNDVRKNAFECLEAFVDVLKRHSARLERGPEAAAALLAAEAERAGAPKPKGGLLKWAVDAAAKRISGGVGGGESDSKSYKSREKSAEEEAAARGVDMSAKAFSSAAPPPRLYGESYTPTASRETTPAKSRGGYGGASASAASAAASKWDSPPPSPKAAGGGATANDDDDDGWGDMDDDDFGEDAEELAARQRLSGLGGVGRSNAPSAAVSKPNRFAAAADDDDGWGDAGGDGGGDGGGWGDGDDDDLFAPAPAQAAPVARRPPPVRRTDATGHVTIGGRGGATRGDLRGSSSAKPKPMKLGAKKITAADIDLESMLG